MSYKERLKESQGGMGDIPKLNIVYNFDVRENPLNKAEVVFTWYEKKEGDTEGSLKTTKKPIEGIFIGAAMRMDAFSPDLGKKGGNYFTSIYFKNSDIVVLMQPGPMGRPEKVKDRSGKEVKGNIAEIESFLGSVKCTPKKHRVLYVLTSAGLVKVETNVSISIDHMKRIDKQLTDNKIKLVPKLYSIGDSEISEKTKEILSAFAAKNPPKYAAISLGGEITDEEAEEWKLIEVLDEFMVWKKWKESTAGGVTTADAPADRAARPTYSPESGQGGGPELPVEEGNDPLPF